MSTIVRTPNPNFAFVAPPLGMPNPTEAKPAGKDTRSRVAMISINDADACWQNAYDRIREHFNAPNTLNTPEHQIEVYLKDRVDALRIYEKIPDFIQILSYIGQANIGFLQSCTKETVKQPANIQRLEHFDSLADSDKIKCKITPILPHFQNQQEYNNLYDYFGYLSKLTPYKINKELLDKLGKNPFDYVQNLKDKDPVSFMTWFKNSTVTQNAINPNFLHSYARMATAEKFGFAISPWQPSMPIEFLIEEIKNHGSLVVGGYFGLAYYQELPKHFKTIEFTNSDGKQESRDTYGWSNAKESDMRYGHVINIVGAEKCSKVGKDGKPLNLELVYYIDPNQNSYPDDNSRSKVNLDKQCILVMSYGRLTNPEKISDVYGFNRNSSPFGFGYYNPKLSTGSALNSVTTSLSSLNINNTKNDN